MAARSKKRTERADAGRSQPKPQPRRNAAGRGAAPTTRIEKHYGEAKRAIQKGLRAFNDRFLGKNRKSTPLAITLRDKGEIVGGLIGETFLQYLFIELLWIDEAHRGEGYGAKLIRMAEDEARKRDAIGIMLDTMSFQAPDFYRKLGFRDIGRLENYPINGHTKYWLAKAL